MDITHNQTDELAISKVAQYPVVTDAIYEAAYSGFKPFAEETQWGPKQGARLSFKITKGKFTNQTVSFKGNFFQDQATGRWSVGMKSKLAEVIRVITGGTETLNKGHIGSKVLISVKTNVSKKNGNTYSNIDQVFPLPMDDTQTAVAAQVTAQAAQPAPAQAVPVQPAQPAPALQSSTLLTDLTDLSDFDPK